jgi:HK97 family phage major capsid protein
MAYTSPRLTEISTRVGEIRNELTALDRLGDWTPAQRTHFDSLNAELDSLEEQRARETLLVIGEQNPAAQERIGEGTRAVSTPRRALAAHTDAALRTIERHKSTFSAKAADNLDDIVRRRDPLWLDARYVAAAGSDDYFSAFGKVLADPARGHLRFSPAEVTAWHAVTEVQEQRGLVSGTGSAGGFAIPISIDPSVNLSANGAINPVREHARVRTIATREWRGVASDGVAASYDAEASEVSDDTPTLVQPTITAASGRAFVPFSLELEQDWASLSLELGRMVTEARDTLDATQFLTGNGTNAPVGILAIGTTGALTTTQRVQTDVAATLDIDDVWDVKGTQGSTKFAGRASGRRTRACSIASTGSRRRARRPSRRRCRPARGRCAAGRGSSGRPWSTRRRRARRSPSSATGTTS